MNGVMTREEVGREVDERLRMVNARLTSLEALKPKAAMIAKAVDGHHHMETVELFDEGTSQGFGYQMDFVGAGVTGTRSGRKFTINITGLGSSINLNEDTVLVGAASTINFTEPDATLLSLAGTTVTVNTNLYAILAGRVGGQTIIGGTVDNTYLSLQGNTVDLTDPVKLLSPLRLAAAANNIIQDSGGTTRITLATSSPHVLLGAPTIGTTVVVRINDYLGVGITPGSGSTGQRLTVGTFANLGASSSTLMSVNIGGTSTANGTFRQGFQFAGIYDLATFNMTIGFIGIAAVPTIVDSIGGGTLTNFVPVRAGIIIGNADNGILVTNSSAFEAIAPTNSGFGFGPIATSRGLRVFNQGLGIITNSVGVDVEAQSGSATASIGVRIALATTYALQLSDTGGTAAGGIQFGTDLATLYRSAANTLKTDGSLLVATAPTNTPGTITAASSKGTGLGVAWDNHTHAYAAPPAVGNYDVGTTSIATEQFLLQYTHLKLTGSERLTMAGTAEISIDDFDNYEDPIVYVGTPIAPPLSCTLRHGYQWDIYNELQLTGINRVTLQGASDLILTDDFKTRNRIVLAGGAT